MEIHRATQVGVIYVGESLLIGNLMAIKEMATMIKFRAWYMPFGKYGAMQEMVFSRASHILALAETEPEKYIPEQFTGLKDVNGKDIYDGDIVSVFNEDGNYYNDVIEWCIKYNYPAFELKYHSHLYESNALSEIMNAGVENIKVIGNAHENPELLKG